MLIRRFEDQDTQVVLDLWREAFPKMRPWHHPPTDIRRKATFQGELFVVAVIDESVVGTAMAGFDGYRGYVYRVAVDQDHRRRGIATALMRRVEAALRALDCPKLKLQVEPGNTDVIAFYRHLGYQVDDFVDMGKPLKE